MTGQSKTISIDGKTLRASASAKGVGEDQKPLHLVSAWAQEAKLVLAQVPCDEEILRRTEQLMQQGVAGIVYGRNVIQHEDPRSMTRALMAIVHSKIDAAADDGGPAAVRLLRGDLFEPQDRAGDV